MMKLNRLALPPHRAWKHLIGAAFVLHLLVSAGLATVVPPVTLGDWRAATPGAGTEPASNWDGDLWDDLMEFAIGADPARSTPVTLNTPVRRAGLRLEVQSSGAVDAVLWRPVGLQGISYVLETSTDLVTWTAASAPVVIDDDVDNGELIGWTNINGSGTTATGFARLKVVLSSTLQASYGGPLGWTTPSFAAAAEQTYGATLLPAAFYVGAVGSVSGSTLTVRGASSDDLRELWPAGKPAYLEFTEGPAEGHRIAVTLSSSTAQTLALDLAHSLNTTSTFPSGMAGARFVLRAFNTIDDVFPKDKFLATDSVSTSDRMYWFNSTTWKVYYLFEGWGISRRWVDYSSIDDKGETVLGVDYGYFVDRRGSALSFVQTGEVRAWGQRRVAPAGEWLQTGSYPLNQSPVNLGIMPSSGYTAQPIYAYTTQINRWIGDVEPGMPQWESPYYLTADEPVFPPVWHRWGDVTEINHATDPFLTANRAFFIWTYDPVDALTEVPSGLPASLMPVNPFRDSDGDGLPDYWEMGWFGSLTAQNGAGDADSDGLANLAEHEHGTSPTDADTDDDTVNDGDEVLAETDPNDFFNGVTPTLVIISGDAVATPVEQWTSAPLVVEVRHPDASPWPHARVIFQSSGVGLSATSSGAAAGALNVTAGTDGRAGVYALMPATESSDLPVSATCSTASVVFHLASGLPNGPPVIAFTSPSPASVHSEEAAIAFTLSASDPDEDALTVRLYDRSTLLGTATEDDGVYSFTWTSPVPGNRIVLARATDPSGHDSWAALPVHVKEVESDVEALGPVEGGMSFAVAASADDLRSTPFSARPVFMAKVGSVSGSTLTFNEQPDWVPSAYQTGHFLYVRSGARTGSVLNVVGNSAHSLMLASNAHGVAANDVVALIPKWSLHSLLPADAVHAESRVFVATTAYGAPALTGTPYGLASDGLWYAEEAEAPGNVFIEPWSPFRIIHPPEAAPTLFQTFGDAAMASVRVTFEPQTELQQFWLAPVSAQALSLTESGLADAGVIREGGTPVVDTLVTRGLGTTSQTWQFLDHEWYPATGTDTGSTPVLLPGGALIINRAPSTSATTWMQPAGK